jgi:hypothetical protein
MLLYNSHLRLFPGKLKSRWEGPYEVAEPYPSIAIRLKRISTSPWIVNGQRLKHYRKGAVNEIKVMFEEEAQEWYDSLDSFSTSE